MLFKPPLARPKWIKENEKKKWWQMKYPQKGIDRGNQFESTFETGNAAFGSIVAIVFGGLILAAVVGLVIFFNWLV